MKKRDIVVIGGSAGSHSGLQTMVSGLPKNLHAAIFIVVHVAARSVSILPSILNRLKRLPVANAQEGEVIKPGRIYVAPPDRHLLLARDHIHVTRGPKEGLHRPSINLTFRSAASAFGDRVIGVLLSGMLDDGASGLWDIAARNGVTIIQDPEEAAFPSMPQNAWEDAPINFKAKVQDIAPLLAKLVAGREVEAMHHSSNVSSRPVPDKFSGFTCPECRGPLYEHRTEPPEFRCRVGHVFPLRTLIEEETSTRERKLYEAIVALEEGADLADYAARRGTDGIDRDRLAAEAAQLRRQAAMVRRLVEGSVTPPVDAQQD
jgi:two-component system, chemotaxis family, protein-glutamate methylesterase/glutaminase